MNPRTMKIVGTFIVGSYGLLGLWTLTQIDKFPIGDLSYGEYSIFSSEGFFYAYHIWGFILSGVTIYGMWKEVRMLFMVGFLLLGLQMFYPWFTSSPTDRQKGIEKMEQIRQDSLDKVNAGKDTTTVDTGAKGFVEPPPMDQLSADTVSKED